jgi:hypothetical protein
MTGYDFEAYAAERDAAQQEALAAALALTEEAAKLSAANAELAAQNAALEAEVARLGNLVPAGTPRTVYGACPAKGGESLSAQTTVVTKYDKGAAVRQFFSASTVAPRDPNVSLVHGSWKPALSTMTEAWAKAITANLLDGDVVEVWHEADNKVSGGTLTYADALARKNRFYDLIKKVRPGLLVANTVTGWLMDPKSGKDPTPWGAVKADVFGIDCDGVRPTKLPYTDYTDETKAALAFIDRYAANGYQWFAVPEFGCPRIVTADPDGKQRAAYHDTYAKLWMATGRCLYATLYEYDSSPNYSLTQPAELAQWTKVVRAGVGAGPMSWVA